MPIMAPGHVGSPSFSTPPLSHKETQWLIKHARESARVLVQSVRGSPQHATVRWDPAGTYKRVQMYKGEPLRHTTHSTHGRPPDKRIHLLCGRTTLHGTTIEEVADYFDISTTSKLKAFAATQDDVQDGVVLYTLVAPGPESGYLHQVTIKWISVRMPAGIAKPRDFLTLECQDSFTDTTGRRGWVRSFHSIKMPTCPDRQGFVRGSMYHSGYVFVETETRGVLACTSSLQVDLKGSLVVPRALYDVGVKRRLSALAHLQDKLDVRRLGSPQHRPESRLDPLIQNESAWCQRCVKGLGMLAPKIQCHQCGISVCHSCSESVRNALSTSDDALPRGSHVCVACASKRVMRPDPYSTDSSLGRRRPSADIHGTRPGKYHTTGARRPVLQLDQRARSLTCRESSLSTDRGRAATIITTAVLRQWQREVGGESSDSLDRDSLRRALCGPPVELEDLSEIPSERSATSVASLCDSLNDSQATTPFLPSPSEEANEDPTVSAVELYRGILALQRAQRTALSASTRGRLADELVEVHAKLHRALA